MSKITCIYDLVQALRKSGQLSEKEIESKFSMLSLSFKMDKLTLHQRKELQQRYRKTAEKNMENESKALKEYINILDQQNNTPQMQKLISRIYQQIEMVQQASAFVSSRAELYGAIQLEERMNRAFEVIAKYVEKLKRVYDKDHQELEDIRRLLIENKVLPTKINSGVENDELKKPRLPCSYSPSRVSENRGRRLSTVVTKVSKITAASRSSSSGTSSCPPSSSSGTPSPKYLLSRRSSLPTAEHLCGFSSSSILSSALKNKSWSQEDIPEQESECLTQEE
ncbi:lymphoid-restricted membrane protein-like isoform X2 [Limulus polyphemus]|uniref:Lymphoid-restricted membrane protein-like isoform X2 n=1 Tax=Limulus polyphemus TaxID=6850 RepID=A0ABM1BS01_LIMPO|nr:lymphoid-restricted membrane protein-like isoform X2 [Limulus polyphemus]